MTTLAQSKSRKTYYDENGEKMRAYSRSWYASLTPEEKAEKIEKARLKREERKKQVEEFLS